MAWETRGNNIYYYRKRRVGCRVISEYIGRGAIAQEIAFMDLETKEERLEKSRRVEQQLGEFSLFENQVTQVSLLVDRIVGGFLVISGFHKRKGQWRRRRDANGQG